MLAILFILAPCGNLLINGNYKTYVNKQISDDGFLTIMGGIASLINGCSRILWSMLYGAIGVRRLYFILMVTNIILFCTIQFTIYDQNLYFLMVVLINFNYACVIGTGPSIAQYKFGQNVG
jgi:hypothetical protein